MVLLCLIGQQTHQTWTHRESMGYCREEDEKQERPKNADELKATVKETWASIPPQQCHKLITSMPRRIEAVVLKQKEPLPSIEYIYSNEHTFPKANNSLKMFFLLVLWSILICWDSELVGFC